MGMFDIFTAIGLWLIVFLAGILVTWFLGWVVDAVDYDQLRWPISCLVYSLVVTVLIMLIRNY